MLFRSMLDERGKGVDAVKVLGALDSRQEVLGNQELQGMKLTDARGAFGDRESINQINALVAENKLEEARALASGLYNNSAPLNSITQRTDYQDDKTYNRRRDKTKDEQWKLEFEQNKQNADRNYNLSAAGTAQSITSLVNPNGGEDTVTYEFDPETQQFTSVTKPGVSNAEVFSGIYSSLTKGGGFATGSPMAGTGSKNVATYGGSGSSAINQAVTSNLQEFAKNTKGKRGTYLPLMNNDMANVAMMAIESGGKGMGTTSYNGTSFGPMQINREFSEYFRKRYKIQGDPMKDEKANIQAGVAFFSELRTKYKGDLEKASAAYNGGEGTVDSAVKRWEKAGRKGHWLDHLGNKDPKQVRDHVAKYMEAYKRLDTAHTGAKARQANGPIAAATQPKGRGATIDNPFDTGGKGTATQPKQAPIVFSGKAAQALGGALNSYQDSLNKDGLLASIKTGKSDKLAQVAELENFKTSNGIGTGWAIGYSQGKGGAGLFGNDANDVYNELTKDKEFTNQSAANQLMILKTVINKNKAEQTLGFNLHGDQLRSKGKEYTRQILADAKSEIVSKKYNHLITAAQQVKNAKGAAAINLPLETIMEMIDKDTYNAMRAKEKKK